MPTLPSYELRPHLLDIDAYLAGVWSMGILAVNLSHCPARGWKPVPVDPSGAAWVARVWSPNSLLSFIQRSRRSLLSGTFR